MVNRKTDEYYIQMLKEKYPEYRIKITKFKDRTCAKLISNSCNKTMGMVWNRDIF